MDDPIFDPWGDDDTGAADTAPVPAPVKGAAPRWRSASARPPVRPPSVERARLPGAAGFLRSMAVPRLEEVVQRLELARHEAALEDALDGPVPRVRLWLRAHPGPLDEEEPRGRSRLEMVLEEEPEPLLRLRAWADPTSEDPSQLGEISLGRLGASWLDERVMMFVGDVLGRA